MEAGGLVCACALQAGERSNGGGGGWSWCAQQVGEGSHVCVGICLAEPVLQEIYLARGTQAEKKVPVKGCIGKTIPEKLLFCRLPYRVPPQEWAPQHSAAGRSHTPDTYTVVTQQARQKRRRKQRMMLRSEKGGPQHCTWS